MEINPRRKKTEKFVKNEEGSLVSKRRPEIQLYLESSNLNLKKNAFYTTAKDKLHYIIQNSFGQRPEYVLGLAKYLSDKGLKTAPVVLLSSLSSNGYSFDDEDLAHIFNTPKRIAEAVALQNMGELKLNNSFKKHVLKVALENMAEHTLKKTKMKRNKVKLRDLIKLLRPKPNSKKISTLYKDLIENSKSTSLKETGQNMITVKSSTTMTDTQKRVEIEKNVDKIPINQLIRNLKFFAEEYDFKKNIEVQKKVHSRLESISNYRFLNIFDVITAAINVPVFEKALFDIVKKFIASIEFSYGKKATLLFDTSGSMHGEGFERGFLYLVLFAQLFEDIELRLFSDKLFGKDKESQKILDSIRKGALGKSHKDFLAYALAHNGGTALVRSADELIEEQEKRDGEPFIVISDEVSWVEGSDLRKDITNLSDKLAKRKLILINPVVTAGTVIKTNVVAVASLNPSILTDMAILTDQQGFINYISNYKKVSKNKSRKDAEFIDSYY